MLLVACCVYSGMLTSYFFPEYSVRKWDRAPAEERFFQPPLPDWKNNCTFIVAKTLAWYLLSRFCNIKTWFAVAFR